MTSSATSSDTEPRHLDITDLERIKRFRRAGARQDLTPEEVRAQEARWEAEGGHPQKQMMRTVAAREDGTVLCFDTGGDRQPAHGEMSCQLAYASHHYVRVTPGDFLFADNDGVQVIPEAYVDEVLLQVEETFEVENAERAEIAAGMPVDEVYRKFGVL